MVSMPFTGAPAASRDIHREQDSSGTETGGSGTTRPPLPTTTKRPRLVHRGVALPRTNVRGRRNWPDCCTFDARAVRYDDRAKWTATAGQRTHEKASPDSGAKKSHVATIYARCTTRRVFFRTSLGRPYRLTASVPAFEIALSSTWTCIESTSRTGSHSKPTSL